MAQVGNNVNDFSGEYLVQDQDHLAGQSPSTRGTKRAGVRQVEQSQSHDRQQGNSDQHASQQGGERHRRSR